MSGFLLFGLRGY